MLFTIEPREIWPDIKITNTLNEINITNEIKKVDSCNSKPSSRSLRTVITSLLNQKGFFNQFEVNMISKSIAFFQRIPLYHQFKSSY